LQPIAIFDWAELEHFDRWTENYLQSHDRCDSLASPALADLRGLPPLLIQVGSAEMLYDQVIALAQRAREAGCDVTCSVYPNMIHNWHTLASMFPIAQQAIDEIGAFVRRVCQTAELKRTP
jgi:monoterpene epsilon-lactone hydrolase